jgi:hypothetical protein
MSVCAWMEMKLFRSIREAFMEAGIPYDEVNPKAILVWHDSIRDVHYWSQLRPWQIINRIPNINVICRKFPFARLIERMRGIYPSIFSSFPANFLLPVSNSAFMAELRTTQKTYIVKPDGGSLGQGIGIVAPGQPYSPNEDLAVAQEYIDSYLMDGRKFDLRIYVLVASVDPLTIYVYRDGLARFCSEDYSKDSIYAKVSNVTLNRENAEEGIANISRLISEIFPQMELYGIDIARLWRRIDHVVVLSIISAHSFLTKGEMWNCPPCPYPRCFQILGFDVLLDRFMQPRVLEVNYRPNLDYYRGSERRMKVDMIRDAILIAAPYAKLQEAMSARQWVSSKLSWSGFVEANPELLESADRIRREVLARSKFDQVWPLADGEVKKGIQKILVTVGRLKLEAIPGFKIPDNVTLVNGRLMPQGLQV